MCVVLPTERENPLPTFRARDPQATLRTLQRRQAGEEPHLYSDEGLRPIYHPFWVDLPHTDIFRCMTPDILHQLLKGVFNDHLLPWITTITGEAALDARFQVMSNYQGLRHFKDGISCLSQWTGKEIKEVQRTFLVVIAGLVNDRIFAAAQGLMDFIYYAQYSSHTTESLAQMQLSLANFHANKDGFVNLGIRDHFNISKFHNILHYSNSIRALGSADGYNTERPERLHIDYAKKAYRAVSCVDYIAQMTEWLQRQEAIH